MAEERRITMDRHLYLLTGQLNQEQVTRSFKDAIKEIVKMFPDLKFKEDFYINVVTNRSGYHYGIAYAWVSDIKIYYVLCGKNVDGTERIESVPDPKWKAPELTKEEALEGVTSWALIDEIEDSYIQHTITRNLDPLVELAPIKYTEDQQEEAYGTLIQEHRNDCHDCRPSHITLIDKPEFGFITCESTRNKVSVYQINTLVSSNIPEEITEDDLYKFFKRFSSDQSTHVKGKKYPNVTIEKKKCKHTAVDDKEWRTVSTKYTRDAYIEFSPFSPHESVFLDKLLKIFTIKKDGKEHLMICSQKWDKGDEYKKNRGGGGRGRGVRS